MGQKEAGVLGIIITNECRMKIRVAGLTLRSLLVVTFAFSGNLSVQPPSRLPLLPFDLSPPTVETLPFTCISPRIKITHLLFSLKKKKTSRLYLMSFFLNKKRTHLEKAALLRLSPPPSESSRSEFLRCRGRWGSPQSRNVSIWMKRRFHL